MDRLLFGKHPGQRANHGKGVATEGSFIPSAEASKISTASLFRGPTIPDGAGGADPQGKTLKFRLSDGSDLDVVLNSPTYFPVSNGEKRSRGAVRRRGSMRVRMPS